MPLFEVALLRTIRSKKEKEEAKSQEELLIGPVPIIANNNQAAAMKAVVDNHDKLKGVDLSDVQVLCRPFA